MIGKTPQTSEAVLTIDDLSTIMANALSRGDTRELALLEVSLTGIRIQELLGARFQDFRESSDLGVVIRNQKSRDEKNVLLLKFPPSNFLRKWVRTSGVMNSEWLFPDPKDKNKPLSVHAFNKIAAGWFRGIDCGCGKHTFHSIQRTLAKKSLKDG
jgi:integrase